MDEATVPSGTEAPSGLVTEQPEGAGQSVADTPVTIDGVAYTQDELRASILRQQDYTRKTQDLAAQRQALAQAEAVWQALQDDPKGTLATLEQHFAEALKEAPAATQTPEDARWQQVESFMKEQQQREAVASVNAEIAKLQLKYGMFDGDAVLQHALELQIPNLEVALRDFRAVNPATQQAAADAAALAAKQNLPPVSGGSHAAGTTRPGGKPISTVADALNEALAEVGATSLSSLPSDE